MSRQAYYQHFWQQESTTIEQELIIKQVQCIRTNHRAMGTRKLYEKLQPFMIEHQIKMGRDALFDCLAEHKLLIRRRKRKITTTMSYHRFQALKMALEPLTKVQTQKLIHHSDRGVQYCSDEYVKLLQDNEIQISMTESSEPTDNAIAERLNGILKDEYLHFYDVENIENAKEKLKMAVDLYNQERPHMSIGNLTPEQVHQNNIQTEKLWKTYPYKKQTEEVPVL